MSEVRLHMDTKLNIRLLSVSFRDKTHASVTFELFSTGNTMGPGDQPMLTLIQETGLYRVQGNGLPDYDAIVAEAAKKLERDFRNVLEALSKTYPSQ